MLAAPFERRSPGILTRENTGGAARTFLGLKDKGAIFSLKLWHYLGQSRKPLHQVFARYVWPGSKEQL